jgi:hypothetical protein
VIFDNEAERPVVRFKDLAPLRRPEFNRRRIPATMSFDECLHMKACQSVCEPRPLATGVALLLVRIGAVLGTGGAAEAGSSRMLRRVSPQRLSVLHRIPIPAITMRALMAPLSDNQ